MRIEKSFLDNRISQLLIHFIGWAGFLFFPFIIGLPFKENIFIRDIFHTALLVGFFYFNSNFLIPKFLTQRENAIYFAFIILILVFIVAANLSFNHLFNFDYKEVAENMPAHKHSYVNKDLRKASRIFFSSLFIFAVSTCYRLLLDWYKAESRKKEIENENLVSELSFLKSQVSPHFLFNTLNNIYSLSLNNSELTSEAILRLSQLLRYMLYESDVKQVSLDKEIEYLNNYIELQKMRVRGDVNIIFLTKGNFSENVIEPMLLIPFIENAFKHGSEISIDLNLTGNTMYLKIENRVNPNKENDKASGIGLNNVKRRLNLLYAERHKLSIEENKDKYIVQLKITLRK
ncbi:MAG TPA: histidine kinase [Cytophagaceae bacterium]|nr:histidine kinase [Cytophagaceae bacterium]